MLHDLWVSECKLKKRQSPLLIICCPTDNGTWRKAHGGDDCLRLRLEAVLAQLDVAMPVGEDVVHRKLDGESVGFTS